MQLVPTPIYSAPNISTAGYSYDPALASLQVSVLTFSIGSVTDFWIWQILARRRRELGPEFICLPV